MEHKAFDVVELKATGAKSSGEFEAIVAVFGNVDRDGDRMVPGAFKRTLSPPAEGGRGLPPIVWAHQWAEPPIGVTMEAEEVSNEKAAHSRAPVDGLWVKGELFTGENRRADEVYTAMTRKGGDGLPPLREFSFGYKAIDFEFVAEKSFKTGRVRELKDVDCYEVGPCLVGVNPDTQLLGAKSDALLELLVGGKAGARNSKDDATRLQSIHDLARDAGASCPSTATTTDANAKAAALDPKFSKALADAIGKSWDDIDSSAIWSLSSMISRGVDFITGEDDPADVAKMRAILADLAQMLADEIAEVEPDSGVGSEDVLEMASLPTSGAEGKAALPARGNLDLELLKLELPRHAA